jgi:hypothetical protein
MNSKILLIVSGLLFCGTIYSQINMPVIEFNEDPLTHNMHICSDGEYLYTVNGGRPDDGQISRFTLSGDLLNSYSVELDMRSIMYNKKDGHFYVSTFDRSIYKITDLEAGTYDTVFEELFDEPQATPALSLNGKNLYVLEDGNLSIFKFSTGEKTGEIEQLKCGDGIINGSAAVAVGKKNIYTWDASVRKVYAYNKKGKLLSTFLISDGSYGFSLSYADGKVFVSDDGDYRTGTWYGYSLK